MAAGCGSDDDGGGSAEGADVAQAKKLVAQAEAPVEFEAPGPAMDLGDQLKGKTYFQIVNGLEFPFIQGMVDGVKEAAGVTGMNVVVTDGAGSTSKAARLIEQAIGRDADAIALYGFSPNALTAPIRAAKDAGIPLIATVGQDSTAVPPDLQEIGVAGIVSYSYTDAGRELANYVVADSEGNAKTAIFDVPEIDAAALEINGFMSQLKKLCPDCETTTVKAPLAQWQSGLPSQTSSVIQKDPNINYLFPMFDGMVFSMIPSVNRVNAQDRVSIVSNNASQPLLKDIQDDKPPMAADVGVSTHWLGWGLMDQAARLLTGEEPVANAKIPIRLFTNKNTKDIDLDAEESTWYGGVDFRGDYQKLWGYGG
jgi:ribose transport system substrate-binding protein